MSHRNSDGSGSGRLDLVQLRTFLAVRRTGSFTAAARLLGLSQPTVTAQIRSLERQLDRQLFERLPRGVAATSVADELAARVAAPSDALAAVADSGDAHGRLPAEPVHLAGPAELVCVRVLPALAPLVAEGVRLRVTTGLTDDLLAGLREGRFDLVLSTARPRGRAFTAVPLTGVRPAGRDGEVGARAVGARPAGVQRVRPAAQTSRQRRPRRR